MDFGPWFKATVPATIGIVFLASRSVLQRDHDAVQLAVADRRGQPELLNGTHANLVATHRPFNAHIPGTGYKVRSGDAQRLRLVAQGPARCAAPI